MLPAGEPASKAAARPAPAAAPSGSPTRSPTASPPAPRRSAKRRRSRRGSKARRPLRAASLALAVGGAAKRPGKAFVDFHNDVTARDIALAAREGMRSIEHIKRYTTAGMGADQGKATNLNALAVAADALGKPIAEVGLTTFRPPYAPVTFGALAGLARGDLFDPIRETPLHGWAARQGAVFEDAGQWKRASRFPLPGETAEETLKRECLATRAAAGVQDASTLGKIEVVGPDAVAFLERLYVNAFAKLAVGRCRYALMLSEDGYVIDDGVVMRLAEDRFHVTTTTGGAGRVFALMEDYRQTEWPELKVWATSITEQYATIAINGPKARDILAPLAEGIDLAPAAFPHMSVREGRVAGAPARLARVSFTGEVGFEVNVPADFGESVLEAIWAEGEKAGAVAYGLDALHLLRAEKGYMIVGQETDGSVTPDDLGLSRMVAMTKPDFIGKRSLSLADLDAGRPPPARRVAAGRSRLRPRRRVADRRRGDAGDRRRRARLGDLGLSQPNARPQLRAGAGRRRPQSAGRDAVRHDDGGGEASQAHRAGVLRQGGAPP